MSTKDFSGIRRNAEIPDWQQMDVPEDIRDLLGDYEDSINSMLDELEKCTLAYEAGDKSADNTNRIKRVLHKIKGESSMMGLEDITELTHQTEFAFEEIKETHRPDMLLRYKDWIVRAVDMMVHRV